MSAEQRKDPIGSIAGEQARMELEKVLRERVMLGVAAAAFRSYGTHGTDDIRRSVMASTANAIEDQIAQVIRQAGDNAPREIASAIGYATGAVVDLVLDLVVAINEGAREVLATVHLVTDPDMPMTEADL